MVSATTVKGNRLRTYYAGDDLDFSGQKASPQVTGSGKKMFGFHRLTGPHSRLFEELLAEREVKALDLTISAPKSLSILFALGDQNLRELTLSAHQEANLAVLVYVEQQGLFRCIKKEHGQVYGLPASGMLTLPINHFVNRHLDPQLHTHNLIGNIGFLAGEDQVRAVDYRIFFSLLKHLDRVYKAALRAYLEGCGIATRSVKHGFEICDINRQQIEVFSSRLLQVDRNLASMGRTRERATATQRQAACLQDRPKKGKATAQQLFERWQYLGSEAGVSLDDICRTGIDVHPISLEQQIRAMVEQGVENSLNGWICPTRLEIVNAVLRHALQLEQEDQAIMLAAGRMTVTHITKLLPAILNQYEVFPTPGQSVMKNDYYRERMVSGPELRKGASEGNTDKLELFLDGIHHACMPSPWVDELMESIKRWRTALYHVGMDEHGMDKENPPLFIPKKQQTRIRQAKKIVREQFHDEIVAAQKKRPATAVLTPQEKKTAKIVDDWRECTRLQNEYFTKDPHPSRFANHQKRQHKLDKKFADKLEKLEALPFLTGRACDVLAGLGSLVDQVQMVDEHPQHVDQLGSESTGNPGLIIENFEEELEDCSEEQDDGAHSEKPFMQQYNAL